MIASIVEAVITAAAAQHLDDWFGWEAANHSIDYGEFAPPPEPPPSVDAAYAIASGDDDGFPY